MSLAQADARAGDFAWSQQRSALIHTHEIAHLRLHGARRGPPAFPPRSAAKADAAEELSVKRVICRRSDH